VTRRSGHGALAGVLIGVLVALGACGSETASRVAGVLGPAHKACSAKITRTNVGPLADPALRELSGIAASSRNPGVLWVHNDSGDSARIFALGANGTTRGTYTLSGAKAVDWEDIARGPGPDPDRPALYVGDIGDNAAARAAIVVYRVPEPEVGRNAGAVTLEGVDALELRYPDGAHDAESLLVDPKSGELFVITKNLAGGPVGVYRAPADLAANSTTMLERVGTISLPTGLPSAVTAADVSPDGRTVAVRTYGSVLLWDRPPGTSIPEVLEKEPCRGPIPPEIQGEAIGFQDDSRGYVTVSEGSEPTLHGFRMR
jgi:hypothetical protein